MTIPWWQTAVFYEIYIRSFQDSNGDGIGDLRGIAERLDYLADLGIDAVWITPFYPSPQVDFGYDVSDFTSVDPQFGSIDDFDRLVSAAGARGIRVLVDLVLNHTSDRHPLFASSRSSRHSRHRDWYIWRDGRGDGPPNNWESAFGGPAWTRDETTGQWYYHFFYREQPDLNWRNPEVEAWMFAAVQFWLDRGVAGFRLDAVNSLFEDEDLRDNPPLAEPRVRLYGVVSQDYVHTKGLPELHGVLRRLRQFVERERPGTLLVSEAYVDDPAELAAFYGDDDEVQLPFNFFLAQAPSRSAGAFRTAVAVVEEACGSRWPSLVLSNHDIERACDRLSDGAPPDAVAKLLATMLLTLRGSPFIYYGEEIAMRTEPPARIEDVRDPVGRRFWPRYVGRDGVRRPMPWDAGEGAGFTSGAPWLALPSDAATRHVIAQSADERSVLNVYRGLLRFRRDSPALASGSYRAVGNDPSVFAYLRESAEQRVLVLLNGSTSPADVVLDGATASTRWTVAAGTHRPEGASFDARLAPLEAVVLVDHGDR